MANWVYDPDARILLLFGEALAAEAARRPSTVRIRIAVDDGFELERNFHLPVGRHRNTNLQIGVFDDVYHDDLFTGAIVGFFKALILAWVVDRYRGLRSVQSKLA